MAGEGGRCLRRCKPAFGKRNLQGLGARLAPALVVRVDYSGAGGDIEAAVFHLRYINLLLTLFFFWEG